MSGNIDFDPRADYYGTLGVKTNAADADIKKAYRDLAKRYHPDATGGDKAKEARFKEVSKAYDVLGNKDKRAQYDAFRTGGFGGGPGGGPGGFAGGFPGGAGVDLGDLFSQMFGGAAPSGRRGPGRGGVRYDVFTGEGGGSPFNSFFSSEPQPRPQRVRRPAAAAPVERRVRASDGSVLVQRGDDVHSEVRLQIDEALLGTVKDVATLGGKATVKVPPGASSGTKLRLRGKGVPRSGGAGRGDHYVTVQIDVPKKKLDAKAQKLLADLMKKLK